MTGTFYTCANQVKFQRVHGWDPYLLYSNNIWLSQTTLLFQRRIYGWFDLLGDLGGVTEALVLLFSFVFLPISEHQFILEATSKLFVARTKSETLFVNQKIKIKEFENVNVADAEISKHRLIEISSKDSVYLYFSNKLGSLFPCKAWNKRKKLTKLYKIGANRIESEFNIVKLINNLRDLNIVLRKSVTDPQVENKIVHSK